MANLASVVDVDVRRASGRNGAPANGGRAIARRRSLPGGRAVTGGLLVALAAVGTFAAYTSATTEPTDRFVVAAHDLPVGTRLSASDLALAPMRLPDALAGRAFREGSALVDTVVVGPVGAGELVQASDVVDKAGAPEDREVSIAVEAARAVAGTLRPGDRVDVVATFGTGDAAATLTVVSDAEVVGRAGGDEAVGSPGTETVALALPRAEDAVAVAHASVAAEVTLVRTTGAPADGAPSPYRPEGLRADPEADGGG